MDQIDHIALTLLPNLGPTNCRRLLDRFPGRNIFDMTASELAAIPGLRHSTLQAIVGKTQHRRAEEILRQSEHYGIRCLFFTDKDFPHRLLRAETQDCPVLLYVLGSADFNPQRALAIVGTRKATHYGIDTTAQIVGGLKTASATVVSGLAYGIDTAAHTAALEQGLPTLAVLGHGLDTIYPPSNRNLAQRIVEQGGALVTEYPIGTAINPAYFPARNRIIAALSDATLVVEAAVKGGALITAAIAGGYQREVFAIPGRLSDTYSAGTNHLIATCRALMVHNPDDICLQMNWPTVQPTSASQANLFPVLSAEAKRICDLLRSEETMDLDELVLRSGMGMSRIASLLFDLEMQGEIRALPGRRYQISHT